MWGSRSDSESEKGVMEWRGMDPKRGDLPMARLKHV